MNNLMPSPRQTSPPRPRQTSPPRPRQTSPPRPRQTSLPSSPGSRELGLRTLLDARAAATSGYRCLQLCVPKTSSTSCDQAIFVDQATDASVSSDAVLLKVDRFG